MSLPTTTRRFGPGTTQGGPLSATPMHGGRRSMRRKMRKSRKSRKSRK